MIEAVFVFGTLNVLFEFVLLCMIAPRYRLRLLGSQTACVFLHFLMLGTNLAIHWGTITGSMSAILAFVASILTVKTARKLFGRTIGKSYHPGVLRYRIEEIR